MTTSQAYEIHWTSLDASVIINSCDQAGTIDLALSALIDQDFDGSWEIIVVDDGSGDETGEVVARQSKGTEVPIIYMRLPKRGMRWCLARNLGMRISNGATRIFLDGDMIPDRNIVNLHVSTQKEEPCLLAGNRLWRNAKVDLEGAATLDEQLQRLQNQVESLDPGYKRLEAKEAALRREVLGSAFPWRACFGCHLSIPSIPNVTYDESMIGWGPADIEFACRLYHHHNLPVRFLPSARAWHVEQVGCWYNPFRTTNSAAATEYVRQVCYMLNKHRDLSLGDAVAYGFDRLTLDVNDQWHVIDRHDEADVRYTLEEALKWYARHDRVSPRCTARKKTG